MLPALSRKGQSQIPCIGIIAGPGSSGSSQDCSVRQWCRIIGNVYNPLTSYTKHLRCYRGCRLRRCTGSIRGIGIIRIVRSIRGCGRSSGRRRGCGIRCACRRRLRSSTGSRFRAGSHGGVTSGSLDNSNCIPKPYLVI